MPGLGRRRTLPARKERLKVRTGAISWDLHSAWTDKSSRSLTLRRRRWDCQLRSTILCHLERMRMIRSRSPAESKDLVPGASFLAFFARSGIRFLYPCHPERSEGPMQFGFAKLRVQCPTRVRHGFSHAEKPVLGILGGAALQRCDNREFGVARADTSPRGMMLPIGTLSV